MADNPQTKVEKLIKYGNEKFGLNETSIRGILDNASAGGGTTEEPELYLVKVIDYDGTEIDEKWLKEGDTYTLPTPPVRDRLVFAEWSCPVEIVDNKITVPDQDVIIGAIHNTISGLSEFDISLTKKTGLSVTLYLDGTKDWGDGTSDTETTHTYADYGDYMITCGGSPSTSTALFGQPKSSPNGYVISVRYNTTLTGSNTFAYCDALRSIAFSQNVKEASTQYSNSGIFQLCRALGAICFNRNIAYDEQKGFNIGQSHFYACANLKYIAFPTKMNSVGSSAFSNCDLRSFSFPLNYMGDNSSDKYLASTCFGYNRNLKRINIYNLRLYDELFYYCSALEKIKLSSRCTSLPERVFGECYKLSEINIPISITSIKSSSFSQTAALKNIYYEGELSDWVNKKLTIPTFRSGSYTININSIYFNGKRLEHFEIPEETTELSSRAFAGMSQMKTIKIPKSITKINASCFVDCAGLISIDLSETTVSEISGNCFNGCKSLKEIILPDTVTKFDTYALSNCYSLEKIKFPAGFTSIAAGAFQNCYSLIEYDFSECTQIPTLAATSAFTGIRACTKIIVPDALYDEWIAATNWSTYADYIYKVSEVKVSNNDDVNNFVYYENELAGVRKTNQQKMVVPSNYSINPNPEMVVITTNSQDYENAIRENDIYEFTIETETEQVGYSMSYVGWNYESQGTEASDNISNNYANETLYLKYLKDPYISGNDFTATTIYRFSAGDVVKEVEFSEGFTTIGSMFGMANIEKVILPSTLTNIIGGEYSTLIDSSSITEVEFKGSVPPIIADDVNHLVNKYGGNLTITVPSGTKAAYDEAFGSYIESAANELGLTITVVERG